MIRAPHIEPPEGAPRHEMVFRVRFGDTDAAGIVYYANFFRYFEAGRAELMRALGLPYVEVVSQHGLFMPVVDSWCRYRASARYDDELRQLSWVHELRAATVLIGTRVYRDDELLVEGGVRLGCVGPDGRARRLPEAMRAFAPRRGDAG